MSEKIKNAILDGLRDFVYVKEIDGFISRRDLIDGTTSIQIDGELNVDHFAAWLAAHRDIK